MIRYHIREEMFFIKSFQKGIRCEAGAAPLL